MTPEQLAAFRIDNDDDGLDDLAIGGDHVAMVRLERMSDNSF